MGSYSMVDSPTKTTPIWEARKWRIASAGTQNLRHWGQIWRRRGGARLRRGGARLRRAAQRLSKAAPAQPRRVGVSFLFFFEWNLRFHSARTNLKI